MNDDTLKKTREAVLAHIRARLRTGCSMKDVRNELVLEVAELLDREVLRALESRTEVQHDAG